jgi:hypothetical protein
VYGHLPLLAALTCAGVGVKLAILAAADADLSNDARVTLAGGVAVLLLVLSVILVVCEPGHDRGVLVARLIAAGATLVIAVSGAALSPTLLTGMVAAILVADLVVETLRRVRRVTDSVEGSGPALESPPLTSA